MKPTNYTSPSIARLVSALNLSTEQAATVRGLIRGEISTRDKARFPQANAWFDSCFHQPQRADRILACVNETMDGFGVEPIWGNDPFWPAADYINTGDTYNATILFNRITRAFSLTTFGDFIERNEKRYSIR